MPHNPIVIIALGWVFGALMLAQRFTFIFNELDIDRVFKSNTKLLILDPEVLDSLIN